MSLELTAVCHTCGIQHGLSYNDIVNTNSIRAWENKHHGHLIEFLNPEVYDVSISKHAIQEYKHNANVKLALDAHVDYTIGVSGLVEDPNLLIGRQSTQVNNTSNLYLDYMVAGEITVGTSPTTNGDEVIEVVALGSQDETPTWMDNFSTTDAYVTITNTNIKNSVVRYVARTQADDGTNDQSYPFGPISLVQLFGVCPSYHIIFVSHSTGPVLNNIPSNHVINYQGVYATII